MSEDDEIASTSGVRPPRYRPELIAAPHTTGSRSGDYVEAIKLIDPVADLRDLKEIPCARKSLMAGIGSGAGIGLLRMMTGGPFAAFNWTMFTFLTVSGFSFYICGEKYREDRAKAGAIQKAMDERAAAKALQAGLNRQRSAQAAAAKAQQQQQHAPVEQQGKGQGSRWWAPWR